MGTKIWSDEDEDILRNIYENETQDVHEIATKFGKGHKSIISKLVNMGIYIKPEVQKKNVRTVKNMLLELENLLDIRINGVNLNKKDNLLLLVDAIEKKVKQEDI